MQIGFIGLGQMGSGMAAAVLAAGHSLRVYNRTTEKSLPFGEKGAQVASTVRAASEGAQVVFTCLADDAAIEQVAFGPEGIIAALPGGAIHIGTSTTSVELSERLAAAHAEAGQHYVAAPVFGRPNVAAAGALLVIAAGDPAIIEEVRPVLDTISRRVEIVGDNPAQANLAKLAGNFLIGSVIESLGEALALVAKGGIDAQAYLDLMAQELFQGPIYSTYGQLIVDEAFEPAGFSTPLGAKDVRLVLAAGEKLEVPMQLASLLRDRLMTVIATGGARKDWSSLGALAKRQSGQ